MAYQIKDSKGRAVKHQGKDIYGTDITNVLVKSVDLGTRSLLLIGTDETRDRDGDILTYSGWKFENFYKNPVFLWAHDYSSVPLAKVAKIIKRPQQKRYDFSMKFPSQGINPFADMILAEYYEKIINASSVGFIPFKHEDIEDKAPGTYSNRRYTEKELLELSGCPVPCNPSAVQEMDTFMEQASFGGMKAKDLFSEYKKGNIPGLKKDELMEELSFCELQIIENKSSKNFYNNKPDEGFSKFVVEEVVEEKKIEEEVLEEKEEENDRPINKTVPVDIIEKSGAVLNKKNLSLLESAIKAIQEVIDSAKKDDTSDSQDEDPEEKNSIDSVELKANSQNQKVESIYEDLFKVETPNKEANSDTSKNDDMRQLTDNIKKLAEALKSL